MPDPGNLAGEGSDLVEGCRLPRDLLYDLEFEVWVRPGGPPDPSDPSGAARLLTFGLMAPFTAFVGKLQEVRYRPLEGVVERGKSVATAESVRYTGALRMPVRGEVVERNPLLSTRPKWLNDEPYERGWVARVRPADDAPLPSTLRPARAVEEEVRALVRERRTHCYAAFPDVEIVELGSECSAVLLRLDEELARRAPDEVVLLVVDDPTAPIELERWRMQTGHAVVERRRDRERYLFLVRKEAVPRPERPR